VFRIDGQTATMIPIQVGRDLGKMVEVTSGLTEGEKVVLTPPGKLATGQKIESATN